VDIVESVARVRNERPSRLPPGTGRTNLDAYPELKSIRSWGRRQLVVASVTPGGEGTAALAAVQVARAVHDAAAAKTRDLAQATTLVAQAAAWAAEEAADTANARDVAGKLEVFEAAATVQAIALNACYQVAINAAATAAEKQSTGQTP